MQHNTLEYVISIDIDKKILQLIIDTQIAEDTFKINNIYYKRT